MNAQSIGHLIIHKDFINQIPGYFGLVGLDSKFLLMNNTAAKWTGFRSPDDMIGRAYHEIHCRAAEDHELFVKQDRFLTERNHLMLFGYYSYSGDDWKIIQGQKYLLRNEQNQPIAITHHFDDFTYSNVIDISRYLIDSVSRYQSKGIKKQFCYSIENEYKKSIFTEKQLECLFFIMRGKTVKAIARILNLSPRTVEDHVQNIKRILNCDNKSQLVEKALFLGYLNVLPRSLLDSNVEITI